MKPVILSVKGEHGLIVTSVYIVEEFVGKSRLLRDYTPGFVRPEENPVVTHLTKPYLSSEERERNWGYFSLLGDGYRLKYTIRAYNGSYQGTMKFSKTRRGGWSATWETVDMADSSRVARGSR